MSGLNLQGGFIALHNSLSAGWTSASYPALAREGFMKNPIVHRCVRLISETAGSMPWLLYENDVEVEDSDVLHLIRRPNAQQSRRAFIETICGHLLLSGNAYIEAYRLDGDALPSQIHALRPDCVTVETDEKGWPTGYKVSAGNDHRFIDAPDDMRMNTVLHLKLFHPLDDQTGFAPLQAALMALDTHNSAATWNKALLDNAARPSGALVYAPGDGSNLTPEQYDQLHIELERQYSGANNAGKPMILEGGLDWKAMGLSPKDMDFVETKNGASRDIALAFGVPPMLLGIPGDNTYANYQEANRALFRLTVLPMMARIAEAFSAWLEPAVGRSLRFELDLDQIDSLNHEREALWARLENSTFITDDEKRMAVGYTPLNNDSEVSR
ncbi:MAG: phage portal protein [Ahrensia sp.]|nr:phage portal protein [Ahrensia sp.]